MSAAAKEIVDYVCTGAGLCLECSGDFAPGFLIVQIVLLLLGSGLSIFDTITDWNIVIQFRDQGFQNPLLPTDINWLRAWYLFAAIGTIFTAITVFHESLDLLHSMWHTCKRCCSKSRKHYRVLTGKEEGVEMQSKTGDSSSTAESQEDGSESNRDHSDHHYHLYQDGSNENILGDKDENETEDANDKNDRTENATGTTPQSNATDSKDDDDDTIDDACKCCYRFGWNFTTRAETLSFLSLWFHDAPMLTMAVLYAFAQSTCKLPEREDVTGVLLSIGISATASIIAASYRLTRSFIRLFISVGVRIKSKKEASKMGKWGKRCSRILPEQGDAIYPKDTCAEWCIVPYYVSLLFDFILVTMGASIVLSIWTQYLILKHATNFDDSLGIYRFQTDVGYTFVTNISGTIIPPSGISSSYVAVEMIQDGRDTVYCLSEFQYIEKDSEIIFNTVELQPISNDGAFCAVKSGFNPEDSANYSSCTLYYGGLGFKIMRYGFRDPITGKIKLLDNECIILKDRLPSVKAGPNLDLSIDVETHLQYTMTDINTKDQLLILYIYSNNGRNTVMFNVPVARIVELGLDIRAFRTFFDPVNGSRVAYLIRFSYSRYISQFNYNVKEVVSFDGPFINQTCSNANRLNQPGFRFVYGYPVPGETGHYQLLSSCSVIPQMRLQPVADPTLVVYC